MPRTTVTRTIQAPVHVVFNTISDIRQFRQAIPHIVKIEFLTSQQSGVGTRFNETRTMRGREITTPQEVTELVENDHVRMVSDTHGTVWDTVFTVRPVDSHTELTLVMEARPYKLMPRIMNQLIKGMVRKAIEQDLDLLKAFCEKQAAAA